MRIFLSICFIWAFLFTGYAICFGAINATIPIGTPPAYDEWDGALIECISVDACQVNIYSNPVSFYGSGFTIDQCQINIYSSPVTVYRVYDGINATLPFQGPPESDSWDGALVDCFAPEQCQVNIYSDSLQISTSITYFTIDQCQINVYCPVYGTQRKWVQSRTWAQERSWAGEPKIIKWTGNPKAILLVP